MIKLSWAGFLLLVVAGCGYNGTPTRHNDFTPLTSIRIVAADPAIEASHTIAALTSTKLTVIGDYSGLFTRDITDQVTSWSSNASTASFPYASPNNNRVFGASAGAASLTASVGGVTSAIYPLTVSPATVTAIAITPANPSIPNGLTTQFTATGTFSDTTTQDLTFDAVWASDTAAVATVSDAPASKGFAQSHTIGTATISATFGGIPAGTTILTVTPAVLQSIAVSPANPSVLSLSTVNFTATGTYSDGTTPDITNQVAWLSSRPDLATIPASGTTSVTATTLAQGTAVISAALAGVTGTTNLKVTGGTLTGFTIAPATVTLANGTVTRLTATGTFSNGSTRDISGAVAWSTADSNLATVTKAGGNLVWLNALGVTTGTPITAKSGTLTATSSLIVSAPTLQTLTITPPTGFVDLTAGASTRFSLIAAFTDGSTQDVTASSTWSSRDTTKATVDNSSAFAKGRISGVPAAAGPVIIDASYGGLTPSPSVTVTVTTRTLQSLAITPGTLNVGNQVKFSASATYTGTTIKDVTEDTVWSIDKPNVAILADSTSQPGQVVAVGSGSATLTATFGGLSKSVTITVP
ncbi:MAG: Ig-like domain-containing protein [Desulfobacteraceae bacterium]|nr:Ig-like domain-containing protein [Desulfobacteraceae bacterium]